MEDKEKVVTHQRGPLGREGGPGFNRPISPETGDYVVRFGGAKESSSRNLMSRGSKSLAGQLVERARGAWEAQRRRLKKKKKKGEEKAEVRERSQERWRRTGDSSDPHREEEKGRRRRMKLLLEQVEEQLGGSRGADERRSDSRKALYSIMSRP